MVSLMYSERSAEESLGHPEEQKMTMVTAWGEAAAAVHSSLPSRLLQICTFQHVANLFDHGVPVYLEVFGSVQGEQSSLRSRRITAAVDQKNGRLGIRAPSAECAISLVHL